MNRAKLLTAALPVLAATTMMGTSTHAATLSGTGSTFTTVDLTSEVDIDLTGPSIVDWGYFDERNDFSSTPTPDNSKAVSGIGTVTFVPGLVSTATGTSLDPQLTVSFDDGTAPASGTAVQVGAQWGGWAGSEDNAFTLTLNDLGVGTHTVRLFVGHNSTTRVFDMDYAVNATDGNLSGNTSSNAIGSGEPNATYQLVFDTTDASADVVLTLNSTTGGGGSGWVAGYVVETVPEPGSLALLGLGGLLIGARRRHG